MTKDTTDTSVLNIDKIMLEIEPHITYVVRHMIETSNLNQFDCDDLAQELRHEVLRAIPYYKGELGIKVQTYLRKVVDNKKNEIFNLRKKNVLDLSCIPIESITGTFNSDEEDEGGVYEYVCSDTSFENEFVKMDIRHVISTLSGVEQLVCILLMQGFTQENIASKLGISRNKLLREVLPSIKSAFQKKF